MGLTRRNTIIGLGALAGGAGVIGATGAFTSVEADRTLDVNTEGDAAALLAIEPNPDYSGNELDYVDNSSDTVSLDFTEDENGNSIGANLNAVTKFNSLIQVTNNGDQDVDFSVEDYVDGATHTDNGDEPVDENNDPLVDFRVNSNSIVGGSETIGSGTSVIVSVWLNTHGIDNTDEFDSRFSNVTDTDGQITFIANSQ